MPSWNGAQLKHRDFTYFIESYSILTADIFGAGEKAYHHKNFPNGTEQVQLSLC
jgi:hypothetical protein